MTKANNLASLLDANGDVVSSALDNVPASNDASALSTGTLPDGRFPATLPASSGVNLTALNASNLGSGTIPDARFPAALPAISGANLTNLPSSGGISNVVEDTSPQLGANLQSNGHDIQMADGDELRIGNSDDIRIYHSTSGGGQNFIQTGTSGELYIKAGSVDIIAAGINSSAIQMTSAGEVNLLHAGGTKIQTQSDGAKVLGNFRATGQLLGTYLFGVNDTDTGIALGANGANIMQFYTGNTERMQLDSSGRLGIGTASPTKKVSASIGLNDTDGFVAEYSGDAKGGLLVVPTTGEVRMGAINSSGTYFPTFYSNNSEAMRLDLTGRLGLGTTSPSANLQVETSANSPVLIKSTYATGGYVQYDLGANGANIGYLGCANALVNTGGSPSLTDLAIRAQNSLVVSTGGGNERFRVNSSGDVLIGGTNLMAGGSPYTNNSVVLKAGSDSIFNRAGASVADFSRQTSDGQVVRYLKDNSVVGSVSVTSSSTAFNTSSDYRLKENVDYTWDATTRLKQLKPARFNFIADPDTTVDGFLAHEVQSIVPEAITGTKDAMRDEEYEVSPAEVDDGGNVTKEAVMGTRSVPDWQGIDQSKLVPLLCKTILELEARITALESA